MEKCWGLVKGRYEQTYGTMLEDPSGMKLLLVDNEDDPARFRAEVLRVVELATRNDRVSFHYKRGNYNKDLPSCVQSERLDGGGGRRHLGFGRQAPQSANQAVVRKGRRSAANRIGEITPQVLAFGADDTRLLVAGSVNEAERKNQVLELWDLPNRMRTATMADSEGSLMDFYVSPLADTVALWFQPSPSEGNVSRFELRDLQTGNVKATHSKSSVIGELVRGSSWF